MIRSDLVNIEWIVHHDKNSRLAVVIKVVVHTQPLRPKDYYGLFLLRKACVKTRIPYCVSSISHYQSGSLYKTTLKMCSYVIAQQKTTR